MRKRWAILAVPMMAVAMLAAACASDDSSAGTVETAPAETGTDATISRPSEPMPPPEDDSDPRGTRSDPLPPNAVVTTGDGWRYRILDVVLNADSIVAAENQFNDPPMAGNRFVMVRIQATRTGEESEAFFGSRLSLVGESNVEYQDFNNSCGVVPDEFDARDVFMGGRVRGNVCWQVKQTDIPSLLMFDNGGFGAVQENFQRLR